MCGAGGVERAIRASLTAFRTADRAVGVVKRLRIAVLIALLLVPALLHGHRHDTPGSAAGPCAACVAAHHTPAVYAPTVLSAAPALAVHVVHAPPLGAGSKAERPFRIGRAPPRPLDILDA